MFLRFLSRQRSCTRLKLFLSTETPIYRTTASGTGGTAASLCAVTISTPTALGAVPDTATEKSHWVRDKDGKGEFKEFVNTWESYHDFTHSKAIKVMIQ
jgi:N-acyl-phosphatidylethanolamine-hydrolysing phospholipase D